MTKRVLYALALLGLAAIVLVINRSDLRIDLLVVEVKALASFIYLGFLAVGIAIGLLLK